MGLNKIIVKKKILCPPKKWWSKKNFGPKKILSEKISEKKFRIRNFLNFNPKTSQAEHFKTCLVDSSTVFCD